MTRTRREHYFALVESFVNKAVEPYPFCDRYTSMWTQDRDEEYAKVTPSAESSGQQMIASFQRDEISREEFQQEYPKLFGYSGEDLKFQDMIDAIHSACSCFRASPETKWDIDEEQLRQEMSEFLVRYRQQSALLLQTA